MDAPRAGRRRRPSRRAAWWVVAAILLGVALLIGSASRLGIERLPVIAGIVGPRTGETVVLAALGVLLLLAALRSPRLRRAALPLGLAALLAAASSVPILVGRGWRSEQGAARADSLRILSWNINGDLASPATVARLAARERADIVVLPEIDPARDGTDYGPAFRAAGLPVTVYPSIDDRPVETVVLVAAGLGRYRASADHGSDPDRSASLLPRSGGLPALVALHAAQPTLSGNPDWNTDLAWVARRCADPNTIAVGDFNATLDGLGGAGLGRCTDAAALRSAASVGTWPTALPTWAAMPLDHVLVGRGWTALSFTVLTDEDRSGARHRPILAVVQRSH